MALSYAPQMVGAAGCREAGNRRLLLSTSPPCREVGAGVALAKPCFVSGPIPRPVPHSYQPGALFSTLAQPRSQAPKPRRASEEVVAAPPGLFAPPGLTLSAPPGLPAPVVNSAPVDFEVASECSTAASSGAAKTKDFVLAESCMDSAASAKQVQDAEVASQCSTTDSLDADMGAASSAPSKGDVQAEIGSPECPTVGSARHRLGKCKPCAFIFKGGCQSGASCKYCHLCRPGEKKQRVRSWKAARRAEQEPQQA